MKTLGCTLFDRLSDVCCIAYFIKFSSDGHHTCAERSLLVPFYHASASYTLLEALFFFLFLFLNK